MTELGHARKAQQACFVRNSGTLVIWANAMEELEPTVEALSKKLIVRIQTSISITKLIGCIPALRLELCQFTSRD